MRLTLALHWCVKFLHGGGWAWDSSCSLSYAAAWRLEVFNEFTYNAVCSADRVYKYKYNYRPWIRMLHCVWCDGCSSSWALAGYLFFLSSGPRAPHELCHAKTVIEVIISISGVCKGFFHLYRALRRGFARPARGGGSVFRAPASSSRVWLTLWTTTHTPITLWSAWSPPPPQRRRIGVFGLLCAHL